MDVSHLPDENAYRFIAVLNKKVEIGKLIDLPPVFGSSAKGVQVTDRERELVA